MMEAILKTFKDFANIALIVEVPGLQELILLDHQRERDLEPHRVASCPNTTNIPDSV